MKHKFSVLFNLAIVLSLLLAVLPVSAQAEDPVAYTDPMDKLDPALQELVKSNGAALPGALVMAVVEEQEALIVEVLVDEKADVDLSPYFVKLTPLKAHNRLTGVPQAYVGLIEPAQVLKVASLAQVRSIAASIPTRNEPDVYPPDEPRAEVEFGPEDWAALRANAEKRRADSPSWDEAQAFGDGRAMMRPTDWFEVMPEGPHKAQAAWERGYMGEGVAVSVIDDGVDFAHPDLMGTQKIYSSTLESQYNGWPMVMDPFSMRAYFYDEMYGTTYVSGSFQGVTYIDTSYVPALTACGIGISCFKYTPWIDFNMPGFEHTYVIANDMTQSGMVHVGTHIDESLRDYVWGEKVAVLVTDPNTAGVYDTVYVDLDDDYDFRDEKPLTKADVQDLENTYNNMVAYRDMNGDGIADLSGGLLYFIADGVNYIPAFEWLFDPAWFGIDPPANGSLIAMHGPWISGYSHGTQCASNVVGQGVVDAMLPEFRDGMPEAAVYGAAPKAKLVPMNSAYSFGDISYSDAYHLAAIGYDAVDQYGFGFWGGMYNDTDTIAATSNSYGWSGTYNDGWDYLGQVIDAIQMYWAPSLQFLFSTGNGGPGYGTVAPPSPGQGIAVGASTQYGSTGWDTITDTNQIMFNDVASFSNAGPGARQGAGTDVVAAGAYSAGAEELNYYTISYFGTLDGNRSWSTWGGTSRSAPTALGVLALIYEAYKDANGVWPTYDEAKAIFMSTATDVNADVFKQGAGSVNADRGTAVAGGHYGIHMAADSATWEPGDYRGVDYPGFAHIAYPGDVFAKTFTVHNTGMQTVTAEMSAVEFKLVDSTEFTFTVTQEMVAAESAYGAENRDNFYKAFNYFIPITATAGVNEAWYNITVPPETDLMVVRQLIPYEEFDAGSDYNWDNRFYLVGYNWKDVNGDGNVWEDKDGNGVVNFINGTEVVANDVGAELDWDDARTELDRWEYGRFDYNRPTGNVNRLQIHDPLERMHDGLFIGLRHLYSGAYSGDVHLQYRVEFYQKEAAPWLEIGDLAGTVVMPNLLPPGAEATFVATATVPMDMPAGAYEAAIEIYDAGWMTYTANNTVVPVAMNVGAVFTDGLQLAGYEAAQYDEGRLYNNGTVGGYQDWSWREESGDWRFFYTDVPDGAYPMGTQMLVGDQWDDAAPHTDIDTIVLGPTPHYMLDSTTFGTWGMPYYSIFAGYYGPYTLETIANSTVDRMGRATWRFNTSSGANEEWIAGPISDGLHEIMQHNVLFEGAQFDTVFTKTLGTAQSAPSYFYIETYADQGEVGTVTFESALPLNGLLAQAYGLGGPEYILNQPIDFVNSNTIEWTHVFTVENGLKIQLWTDSPDIPDVDLYLFYWNGMAWEERGSSAGADANEYIEYMNPEDGQWMAGVNNWSGPAGHVNLTKVIVQGNDLSVTGLPTGTIAADTPVSFTVNFEREMMPGEFYEGMLVLGPPEAPNLKSIPVTIYRKGPISKSVDKALAFQGDELNYSIAFMNDAAEATTLELVDPIPEGTEFVTATTDIPGVTGLYDVTNNRIYFNDEVDPGNWTINLTVQISDTVEAGTWITNTATITEIGTLLFEDARSDSAATYIGMADFKNSAKGAPAEAVADAPFTYLITVTNEGEALAYVELVDPLPEGTTFYSVNDMPPYQHFAYNATLDQMEWAGNVAPDEEWVFSFAVMPSAAAAWKTITNTATITVDGIAMDMQAATYIEPPYKIYMPLITQGF